MHHVGKGYVDRSSTQREENDGDDPITEVPDALVNQAENVLFRCTSCQRAFHFEHLPPLKISKKAEIMDILQTREKRLKEYSSKFVHNSYVIYS